MHRSAAIFLVLLFVKPHVVRSNEEAEIPTFIAQAGEEVVLSCPVNTADCGEYHSLKWYRNSNRVYVYSPFAQFSNAEGSLMDRCLDLSQRELGPDCPRGSLDVSEETADLTIFPIQMSDDGEYRCEITYLSVSNNCPLVHFSNVTTVASPEWVTMSVSGDNQQPFAAGTKVTVTCSSGGGKPVPDFRWSLGGEDVEEHSETFSADLEAVSEISFVVEEHHDGQEILCWVENEFSEAPLKAQFKLDVRVSVKSVIIDAEIEDPEAEDGVIVTGVEDEEMTLTCRASGGPPVPRITWSVPATLRYEVIEEDFNVQEDETIETLSRISFTPVKTDNNDRVECEAINDVMAVPIKTQATLDILYSPRVSMNEENITAVEGGQAREIVCEFDANPEENVTVTWFRDNKELELDELRMFTDVDWILDIQEVSRHDVGLYSCAVENSVGQGYSESSTSLDVYYPPDVYVAMEPQVVSEEAEYGQVTLRCELASGHPAILTNVTWYKDGEPLEDWPFIECGDDANGSEDLELRQEDMELFEDIEDDDDYYDEDIEVNMTTCVGRTVVTMGLVNRYDSGEYSCRGSNEAGYGDISPGVSLAVQYRPGVAEVQPVEDFLLKGGSGHFLCLLEDLGFPEAEHFTWKLGGESLDELSENLTLTDLGAGSQHNLSCAGVNSVGEGEYDAIELLVYAPPTFVTELPEVTPFVLTPDSQSFLTLSCEVECDPLCDIDWIVSGDMIEVTETSEEDLVDDPVFGFWDEILPSEGGMFTRVRSSLRMSQEDVINTREENFTVTCIGGKTEYGEAVVSTTTVIIEYAPQNLTVSEDELEVYEGEEVDSVICAGDAVPGPSFYWTRNNEVVAEGEELRFSDQIQRTEAGDYTCHAANKHGEVQASVSVAVLFKPECSVSFSVEQEEIVLLCQASGYPNDLTFWWEQANETYSEPSSQHTLRIKISNETQNFDDLTCHVSNSVGESDPCSVDVILPLTVSRIEQEELMMIIIISAVVVAILLLASIVTCVYCVKKSAANKEKENSDKGRKTALPDDEQPHSDKSFYENLPFQGLKSPPKKVINPKVGDDTLDYADAEYKDLYVEGPKGYRKLPETKQKLSSSKENVNGL